MRHVTIFARFGLGCSWTIISNVRKQIITWIGLNAWDVLNWHLYPFKQLKITEQII